MSRRFTDKEVELARRIKANVDNQFWAAACAPPEEQSIEDMAEMIMNAPLQPTCGPTPPWWEQAVAEADQNMVWVDGGGWMQRELWEDILATHLDLVELEKELEDDE